MQIESRIELSRCAKDYLLSYATDSLPFATWLKGVESRIAGMNTLPRSKDLLLLEKDEMKVRMYYVCVCALCNSGQNCPAKINAVQNRLWILHWFFFLCRFQAFSDKVKVEGENLTQIEIKGSSFLGSAKVCVETNVWWTSLSSLLFVSPPRPTKLS